MELLVQNFQFILFMDIIAVIVLFFSFIANQRQGFYGLDLNDLIYFTALRFLVLVTESFSVGAITIQSKYTAFLWLVLNLLSLLFLVRFCFKTLPFSHFIKTGIPSVSFLFFTISYWFYGINLALLFAYCFFAAASFLICSALAYQLSRKFSKSILIIVSVGLVVISAVYVLLAISFYQYIFSSGSMQMVSFSFLLRAIFTIILANSMFFLYTTEHRKRVSKNQDVDFLYIRKIEIGIISSVLIILIFSFFFFGYFKEVDESTWFESSSTHVELHAQSEEKHTQTTEGVVRSLGGSTVFGQGITGGQMQKSMMDAHSKVSPGDIIYVMNKDGVVVDSTNRDEPDSFVGADYSLRPYFKEAINGELDHDYDYVAVGLTSKKAGYYVANKITNKDGESIGVVVGKRTLGPIESDPNGLCSYYTDSDFVVIESSCPELLYKSILPISEELAERKISSKQLPEIVEKNGFVDEFVKRGELYYGSNDKLKLLLKKVDGPLYVGIIDFKKTNYFYLFVSFVALLSLSLFALTLFFTKIFDHQVIEAITEKELETKSALKRIDEEKKEIERLNKYMIGRELKMVELKKEIQRLKNKTDESEENV